MRILKAVRALWEGVMRRVTARLEKPRFSPGHALAYDYEIDGAVDYRQPMIVPGWLQREMAHNVTLRESVLNNMAQSYNSPFANPYRTASDAPMMPVSEDPLREWDSATRERILSSCHAAYQRNPLAHTAVNFTTDFVIGNGFNLVCKNPDVKRVLDDFINNPDNAVRKYERQAVNDLQVDGELILRFFTEAGETVMVPQRPWELKWIKTQEGFYRRPELFHFERFVSQGDSPMGGQNTKPEDVPANEIHFVAINDHAYELRGRPELYRVLPWLKADKDWIEDRARQNRWRNALLWHVRVEGANANMIAAVAARWRKPPPPGSAYVSTAAEEVKPLTNGGDAGDASHDGRAIRLMVILGMRLPEYFFGDGQNANLATATKQELPALTKFEAFQQILIEQVWTPIFQRVLQNAMDAGMLPEEVEEYDNAGKPVRQDDPEDETEEPEDMSDPEEPGDAEEPGTLPTVPDILARMAKGEQPEAPIKKPQVPVKCRTRDAFEVSYEPVTAQDLTALTNMLVKATGSGWASDQTATEKLGFDPAIEQTRIRKEAQAEREKVAAGEMPLPPGYINPLGMPSAQGDTTANNQGEKKPDAV